MLLSSPAKAARPPPARPPPSRFGEPNSPTRPTPERPSRRTKPSIETEIVSPSTARIHHARSRPAKSGSWTLSSSHHGRGPDRIPRCERGIEAAQEGEVDGCLEADVVAVIAGSDLDRITGGGLPDRVADRRARARGRLTVVREIAAAPGDEPVRRAGGAGGERRDQDRACDGAAAGRVHMATSRARANTVRPSMTNEKLPTSREAISAGVYI